MTEKTCVVCQQRSAKYKCPRCGEPYCALACYREHGQCSEDFYQDQVKQTLQSTVADEQQRQATLEMLERLQIQEQEEEDEQLEEERVQRIECIYQRLVEGEDPDRVWLSLVEEERQDFWRFMESGQLADWAIDQEQLVPWYCDPISHGMIQEVDDNRSNRLPATIPDQIPPIQELLGGKAASPLLANNFVEITYVYCFVFRLFVGAWTGDSQSEVIESFLRLSRVLSPVSSSGGAPFQAYPSLKASLRSVIDLSTLPPFSNRKEFSVKIILDVISVLSSKRRCLVMLAHLLKYFTETMEVQKPNSTAWKRLGAIKRKLHFYLSWCHSQPGEWFSQIKEQTEDLYRHFFMLYMDTQSLKPPSAGRMMNLTTLGSTEPSQRLPIPSTRSTTRSKPTLLEVSEPSPSSTSQFLIQMNEPSAMEPKSDTQPPQPTRSLITEL